jgi:hypothetical protein
MTGDFQRQTIIINYNWSIKLEKISTKCLTSVIHLVKYTRKALCTIRNEIETYGFDLSALLVILAIFSQYCP